VLWKERMPAMVLAILIVILGIQPGWLIGLSETTTAAMVTAAPTIALESSNLAPLGTEE